MATYTPQKLSNAVLLTLIQDKIDASATAVDNTTGAVTTSATWTDAQKYDWLQLWNSRDSCEVAES